MVRILAFRQKNKREFAPQKALQNECKECTTLTGKSRCGAFVRLTGGSKVFFLPVVAFEAV